MRLRLRTTRRLVAAFGAGWVVVAIGCGGGGSANKIEDDLNGVDSERAAYYREQAKQVFGTDLVRVEPLRDAMITSEQYSKIRRQLDLREIASNAPKPGAELASRRPSQASDWVPPDRQGPREIDGGSGRASATLGSAGPSRRGSVINPGGDTVKSSRGEAWPGDEVDTRAASRGVVRGGNTNSPWDVEVGREKRAQERAVLSASEPHATDASEPVAEAHAPTSDATDIDPAFRDILGVGGDDVGGSRATGAATPSEPRSGSGRDGRRDGAASGGAGGGGWSIILALYRGDEQAQAAREALARLQTEGGLPEAYIQKRGQATSICYGHYRDEDDPNAQSDLRRIKSMEIGGPGQRPYASVLLFPPTDAAVVHGEFDLNGVRRRYGKDALYTLQVGFYGREDVNVLSAEDRKTMQQAAEQAAASLRGEGELAFFYHGKHRSVVTVGVFGPEDFDPLNPNAESPRLRETRRRHPLNLYNGAGYTGKTPGMREAKLVPSALVAVPGR